jgi:iron(II)-dependent oxidoreductase
MDATDSQRQAADVDAQLAAELADAHGRTLALVEDLDDGQLLGPRLAIVNPLLWEVGHVAWFAENWVLRHAGGEAPIIAGGDALWDSSAVPHDTRWDLPLPARAETLRFVREVRARVLDRVARGLDEKTRYFVRLALFHEDMHDEAFTYTRQTHAWPAPPLPTVAQGDADAGPHPGDALVPGGTFSLGGATDEPFVFDNEKWAHEVRVEPFAIARAPVTQGEFAAFVDDGGYRRNELWSDEGWQWRSRTGAEQPVYWRRAGGGWERRHFDGWRPLEPHRPVIHVCWYEAEAWCRWARRRLPTELEWEVAAAGEPTPSGALASTKRRYPWGSAPPDATRAHLDGRALECIDVAARPAGDSAFGCRQMLGNVWQWTATAFAPYPGFVADPYRDYSQPWFHTHKVLRGGCYTTRARLLRNTWRNFYMPDRRDVLAGFRTCAAAERPE